MRAALGPQWYREGVMAAFEWHVLRLQDMPRRNDGLVAAATRAGGASGTAAPKVVMSELKLTVLHRASDRTLLFNLAALFAWHGMTGDAKHPDQQMQRALIRVACSHGPDVLWSSLLSSDPAVPEGGKFVGPATLRAVVSQERVLGFGPEVATSKRRLLVELGLWERRLEAGLPLLPAGAPPAGVLDGVRRGPVGPPGPLEA